MSDTALDERHAIGANRPPEEPDTFGAIKANLDDLLTEVLNWADGTPIKTQAEADEVARLFEQLRDGAAAADEARKVERTPFDERIDEIQARYNFYIAPTKNKTPGKVSLAMEALKATQTAWLRKVEAEKQAEAKRLRDEAQRKLDEAAAALRASSGNMAGREEAEGLLAEARVAERTAVQAENVKAHAFGDGKAIGLRDNFIPRLIDGSAALRHYWLQDRGALEAFALDLAKADVRRGIRTIPGFEIINERRV